MTSTFPSIICSLSKSSHVRRFSIRHADSLLAFATLVVILIPVLFAMGVPFSLALPLSLLLGLTGQHFITLLANSRDDVFAPVTLVAFYFLVCMGFRALYIVALKPDAHRIGRVGYDDYLPEALWCANLAYISFLIGFFSPWARTYLPKGKLHWPRLIPANRIATVAFFGFAVRVLFFRQGVGVVGNTHGQAGNGFLMLVMGLGGLLCWITSLIFLLDRNDNGNKRKALPFVGLSVVYLFGTILITGSKEAFLSPLISGLLVFHYMKSRLRLWQLIALGLPAIVFAFGVINFYRFVIVAEGGSPKNVSDLINLTSSAAHNIGSRSTGGQPSALDQMLARQAGIDALALVMKYTPDPRPFGLGESLVRDFISGVIPRQLWRDKPFFSASREFEQNYLGMPGSYDGHSSPQVLADLYANFWLAGVVGGMLSLGVFLRWFYLFCAPGPNSPAGLLFYALLLPPLLHMMEATLAVIEINFSRLVLFVILGAFFFGVRNNKNEQRRSFILLSTSTLENIPANQGH